MSKETDVIDLDQVTGGRLKPRPQDEVVVVCDGTCGSKIASENPALTAIVLPSSDPTPVR